MIQLYAVSIVTVAVIGALAYLRWLRARHGLADFNGVKLHYRQPGDWKRGQVQCIGATFGAKRGACDYETGAYSLLMPGYNMHRHRVTFETVDDAGEVIASQTLPVEPEKGGVIWDRAAVRKAAGKGPIPVCADDTPIPVQAVEVAPADMPEIATQDGQAVESPTPVAPEGPEPVEALTEDMADDWRTTTWDDLFAAQEVADGNTMRGLAMIYGDDNVRLHDGSCWVRGDLPARFVGIQDRVMHNASGKPPVALVLADDVPPADPLADVLARLADVEARLAGISAEAGLVDHGMTTGAVVYHEQAHDDHQPAPIRSARTPAHERAVRRAWAERRARRAAEWQATEWEAAQHRAWEVGQGHRIARRRAVLNAKRQWRMRLVARAMNRNAEAEARHERAARHMIVATARGLALKARRERDTERNRANVLAAQLSKAGDDLIAARRSQTYTDAAGREAPDMIGRTFDAAQRIAAKADGLATDLVTARAALARQDAAIAGLGDALEAATLRALRAETALAAATARRDGWPPAVRSVAVSFGEAAA